MKIVFPFDERKEELESLAGLGYTIDQLALYFDLDPIIFREAATDPDTNIHYHIQRGILIAEAQEQMGLLSEAKEGTAVASAQLGKIRRTKAWTISRDDIFGSFEDAALVSKLEDYIQGGSINDLSGEEAIYIDALTIMHSMGRKYGRRNTVRFFTKSPFALKYARASDMYDEAIRLFYTDRSVEKKADRNRYAEQIEDAAIIVRDNATTAKDWDIYTGMIMKAAKLRELDKPDIEKLPPELYQLPVRVFSLDTTVIGLPRINRQDVANQIEALDIPERDKIRIRQDSLTDTPNITERLNELEEESRSQQ